MHAMLLFIVCVWFGVGVLGCFEDNCCEHKDCEEDMFCNHVPPVCNCDVEESSGSCVSRSILLNEQGKIKDGAPTTDPLQCASGYAVCEHCGVTGASKPTAADGSVCSAQADCKQGSFCAGQGLVSNCIGTCTPGIADGEPCGIGYGMGEDSTCRSGQCLVLLQTESYCQPEGGSIEGQSCTMDSQCTLNDGPGLWCKGGGITSIGKCTRCPAKCAEGEGCNACNNDENRMTCGRSTSAGVGACALDVAAHGVIDYLKCMSMGDKSADDTECPSHNVALQTESCFAGTDCEFELGPSGISIGVGFPVTNDLDEFSKEGFLDMDLEGSISFHGSLGLKAKPMEMSATFTLGVTVHTDMKLLAKSEQSIELIKSTPLMNRITILQRVFMLGGSVPLLVEMFAEPYFWGEVKVEGAFEASLQLEHTAHATAELSVDAKTLHLHPKFDVDFGRPVLTPHIESGEMNINLLARVGPRVSISFNQIVTNLDLTGALHGNFQLHKQDSCLAGSAHVSLGIDVRPSLSLEITNPGKIAVANCKQLVKLATSKPAKKAAECGSSVFGVPNPERFVPLLQAGCDVMESGFSSLDFASLNPCDKVCACKLVQKALEGDWVHFPLLTADLEITLCPLATLGEFDSKVSRELKSISTKATCDSALEEEIYGGWWQASNRMRRQMVLKDIDNALEIVDNLSTTRTYYGKARRKRATLRDDLRPRTNTVKPVVASHH